MLRYLSLLLFIGLVYGDNTDSGSLFVFLLIYVFIIIGMFVAKDKQKHEKKNIADDNYDSSNDKDEIKPIIGRVEKEYGKILGLEGRIKMRDIQKAYHDKMKKYHPDKVETMGEELKELAKKKTKKINEAYEYFKKKYD